MIDFEEEWSSKKKKQWLLSLGAYIRSLRKRKNLTGVAFGKLLFMDKPNVTRLEKGRVNPSTFLIKQICDVLDISLAKFWNGFKEK